MPTAEEMHPVSVEAYLKGEQSSEVKHEYIDGHVYAMAGASANHERISQNLTRAFGNHLENSPCEPIGSDMKVRIGSKFFYPDVLVDCNFDDSEPYYTESPTLIVEILSKSTRRTDETTKRLSYVNIPTLQEYVLIDQDLVDIEVVSRSEGWQSRRYYLGDDITLESIGLTLSVEEIYRRVKNEDMIKFMEDKQAQEK
ncbi:MAG: Uma2 family endonuclease [Motiliproteus sp.]